MESQRLTLSWDSVANASGYHIYYSTDPSFTHVSYAAFANGTWLQNVSSPRQINGLTNGQTYYLVITAVVDGVERSPSAKVSGTPRNPPADTPPTSQEVLGLELVNRARFDPLAEAQRYNIGLNDGGMNISTARKPPLAPNLLLGKAARGHSQWMIDNDVFSHTGANGSSPEQRISAVGYNWTAAGENIAWQGTTGNTINLTSAMLGHHELLFKSSGHRENMLRANYREAGLGQMSGNFLHTNGVIYLSSMLTQKFARSGSSFFLTGVGYQDSNSNSRYDPGEALTGLSIHVNGQSYAPYNSGIYAIPLNNGSYTVTVSGGGLGTVSPVNIQINNGNVKLDVIRRNGVTEIVTWQ